MDVSVLFDRRRLVRVAGRRIVCRRLTVEAVLRAIRSFAPEIYELTRANVVGGRPLPANPVEGLVDLFLFDDRCVPILECCATVDGGGDLVELLGDRTVRRQVAVAVLLLTDLSRVAASLSLPDVVRQGEAALAAAEARTQAVAEPGDDGDDDDDGPDGHVVAIAMAARTFGTTWRDVLTWPWEVYVDLAEHVAPLMPAGIEVPGRQPRPSAGLTPRAVLASLPGIGVQ